MSLKTILPVTATAAALVLVTSCLDDETKNSFDFQVSGYVLQGKTADTVRTYSPFIAVSSLYSEYKLADVKVKNDKLSLPMEQYSDWVFQTVEDQSVYTDADTASLNGTYTATATTTTGEVKATNFKIHVLESDTLGPVTPSVLKFTDGTISVTLPPVKNASNYGVIITPYDEGKDPKRISSVLQIAKNASYNADSTEVSYTTQFYRSYLSTSIAGAVVKAYATTSSSLFLESDTSIVILPSGK